MSSSGRGPGLRDMSLGTGEEVLDKGPGLLCPTRKEQRQGLREEALSTDCKGKS
jgi:hypothetical protein